MNFGWAIQRMKEGERVSRAGWNGRGMWLAIHTPGEDEPISVPFIYMCTVDSKNVPWLASQTDVLAEDWQIGPS